MSEATPQKQEARFEFEGYSKDDIVATPPRSQRKSKCEFCFVEFDTPDVSSSFDSLNICPECILLGPKLLADKVEELIQNRPLFTEKHKNKEDDFIDFCLGIYLDTLKALRSIKSFENAPGGKTAVAVAKASVNK